MTDLTKQAERKFAAIRRLENELAETAGIVAKEIRRAGSLSRRAWQAWRKWGRAKEAAEVGGESEQAAMSSAARRALSLTAVAQEAWVVVLAKSDWQQAKTRTVAQVWLNSFLAWDGLADVADGSGSDE